jgi:DHA2 family multidrug resistance protein
MRNIGGSVGIAIMTTFLARRTQMHQSRLAEHITAGSATTQRMLHETQAYFVSKGFDHYTAYRKALGALYGMVQQQASMISFVEAFWIMGVVFLLMVPMLALLRYTKPKVSVGTTAGDERGPSTEAPADLTGVEEHAPQEETVVCH